MDLVGKLLVAMPALQDPRFEHSVILIYAHSAEGAMGLSEFARRGWLTWAALTGRW